MISFLLFLIQFAIDYVMLVVHLYFIIQALVIFTPSTWFRPLHTGGLTSQDVTLLPCPLPHHSCPFEPFFLFPVHPSPCKRRAQSQRR